MTAIAKALLQAAWTSIGGDMGAVDRVAFTAEGGLPSAFPVTDFASAAVATAALSVAELVEQRHGRAPNTVNVDRRLASFWFSMSIRPIGWSLPAPWDPIAGDYATRDGWIRLHTNAPHHRAAAERVLGAHGDKPGMAGSVVRWQKRDLEEAIVAAGGCAAEMRSAAEWQDHPQGMAVAAQPLVHRMATAPARMPDLPVAPARPLQGLRVLDLTRVLAGPVASRFLAFYGADVLRIDPPDWDEPGVVPEVTLGKRCARLDLRQARDRTTFEALLAEADILLHGYRPGALDSLGFDAAWRRTVSPGLIDVGLSAYGWSGPWAHRRGFDSLVQMSTGIADAGMRWRQAKQPFPLPVQALDHATGYLMAATAICGLTERLRRGTGMEARLSLARTAKLLLDQGFADQPSPLAPETDTDRDPNLDLTDWGDARRLLPPVTITGVPMAWDRPARRLGSTDPRWE